MHTSPTGSHGRRRRLRYQRSLTTPTGEPDRINGTTRLIDETDPLYLYKGIPILTAYERMKKNTFYLLTGIIALVEVVLLWFAIELAQPLLIQVAFLAGIIVFYLIRKRVHEPIQDERTSMITQKAAVSTLAVFWIVFFIISIGSVVIGFNQPLGIRPPPHPFPREAPHFGLFGLMQLFLLALIIILYVGFRVYYARQYGEWEQDEE